MIDTVMFDLDGTLLPLDMKQFMNIYFRELGAAFQDLIEPQQLVRHVWSATACMVENVEHRTNQEVFMERFQQLINDDAKKYTDRFDAFYDTAFHKTRESVVDQTITRDCIHMLKEKNYRLILATNPLFPRKAIHTRMAWAGLTVSDFCYITSYEDNHYCKPHPVFFEEILAETETAPEQCMMVGNDVQEDLVASRLGIKTYLITDHMIHRTSQPVESDFSGTYEDFYTFVKALPAVSTNAARAKTANMKP